VTKVEECTSDDTGVGAAMAAGSQALKGICALLVKHPTIIITCNNLLHLNSISFITLFQWPWDEINPIAMITIISPKRLVIAVTIPAL
jgi:hypothetical protein